MRQYFAGGLILAFGLVLLWIGVAGRMGVILGALLCPAQVQTDNPDEDATQADLTRVLPTPPPATGGGGSSGGF